ncbi:hypothetical protein [Propionivibrio limicola]|uniref:hypothetical protein n=1 Tax=Propionivibrio limicola TaxID=167645 RepID=UPI0014788361|nr:hypothetical protein [Propionivibrio limicola]
MQQASRAKQEHDIHDEIDTLTRMRMGSAKYDMRPDDPETAQQDVHEEHHKRIRAERRFAKPGHNLAQEHGVDKKMGLKEIKIGTSTLPLTD